MQFNQFLTVAFLGISIAMIGVCKSPEKSKDETVQDKELSADYESTATIDSKDPDEIKARKQSPSSSQKKGCIKGDCVNGFGVYVYENGDTYTGNFKNDKREGEGSFAYTNAENFKGIYKEDNRDGKGVYQFKNGDKFSGEFKGGEITGPGIYTFADGKVLTGNFTNNGQNGEGTLASDGKTRNCKIQARKLSCE